MTLFTIFKLLKNSEKKTDTYFQSFWRPIPFLPWWMEFLSRTSESCFCSENCQPTDNFSSLYHGAGQAFIRLQDWLGEGAEWMVHPRNGLQEVRGYSWDQKHCTSPKTFTSIPKLTYWMVCGSNSFHILYSIIFRVESVTCINIS